MIFPHTLRNTPSLEKDTLIVKNRVINRLLAYILLFIPAILSAQTIDTISIFYPLNDSAIYLDFAGNRGRIERLDSCLRAGAVDSIYICPSASPDGRMAVNLKLRELRARSITEHIDSILPGHAIVLRVFPQPIDWSNILSLVTDDMSFPYRDKVIAILTDRENSPYLTQQALKEINGGEAYELIASRWLCNERTVICRLYSTVPSRTEMPVKQPSAPLIEKPDTTATCHPEYIPMESPQQACTPDNNSENSVFPLRISTNLLHWAALAPNGGVELPIDGRNNLSMTFSCAWWSRLAHKHVYRWMKGEIGWQHYFSPQPAIDNRGLYTGIYLNTGLFELMFSAKNRKGEYYGVAPAIGYRWRLADHFSLTAEGGIGAAYVSYRHAKYISNTLIYRGKATRWSVFPRIGINLIYNFNSMNR